MGKEIRIRERFGDDHYLITLRRRPGERYRWQWQVWHVDAQLGDQRLIAVGQWKWRFAARWRAISVAQSDDRRATPWRSSGTSPR